MEIRYYLHPETGEPHIHDHRVSEAEVEDVLDQPLSSLHGRGGAFLAYGKTSNGRWLRVVYLLERGGDSIFVITAYVPSPNTIRALRRRYEKKL